MDNSNHVELSTANNNVNKKTKFRIVKEKPSYSPIEREEIPKQTEPNLRSSYQGMKNSHRFYLTPIARKQIFTHIGWGKRTRTNHIEQGGILLGHIYVDSEKQLTYGIVEHTIAAKTKGSAAYVEFSHKIWKEMLDQVDNFSRKNPDCNLQVIGWYHTHPNELPVFMSGTDKNTQARLFNQDWHFAIVLNPHKRIWKAFWRRKAIECEGQMIINPDEVGLYDSKNFHITEETQHNTCQRLLQNCENLKNVASSLPNQALSYGLTFATGLGTGLLASSLVGDEDKSAIPTQHTQNSQSIKTLEDEQITEKNEKLQKQIKPQFKEQGNNPSKKTPPTNKQKESVSASNDAPLLTTDKQKIEVTKPTIQLDSKPDTEDGNPQQKNHDNQ